MPVAAFSMAASFRRIAVSARSTRRRLRSAPALGALGALLLAPALAGAAVIQVTQGDRNSFGASLSADGQRLVFYSAADLDGSNADRNFEVYSHSRQSGQTQALTHLPGGQFVGGNQTPKVSGDGSTVLFQQFELLPNNTARFRSLVDTGAGGVPLTPFNNFEIGDISHDGNRVLLDIGNDGLRLFDRSAGTSRLLAGGASGGFALSGDGRRVARATFSGAISWIDVASGATTQIAAAPSGFVDVDLALSGQGRHLAFTTNLDLLGHNADRNAELYLQDLDTGVLRQLTDSTDTRVLRHVSISDDGSRLLFSSQRDLLGRNADGGEEVYLLDMAGSLSQLTDGPAGVQSFEADLSGDGRTAAWTHLTSGSGMQIVLADLPPLVVTNPTPEPGSLALVAAAGLGWWRSRAARRPG